MELLAYLIFLEYEGSPQCCYIYLKLTTGYTKSACDTGR